MSKRGARNVAIGAAIAAAAGYVTGILTAPKSGKETRKDIQTAAAKAKRDAEAQLKKLHSELTDLLAAGKKRLKTAKTGVKADLEKAMASAEAAKVRARELLSSIHEGDTEDKDLQQAIDEVKKATAHLKKYLETKTAR